MSDIGEANRKYWDGKAAEYDAKPWQKAMIGYIYGQLAEHRELFDLSKQEGKQEFRLLDYACGPGTVSRALEPYVSHIQGIDVSSGMVAEFNRRFRDAGVPASAAIATQGNLLAEQAYITNGSTGEKITNFVSDPRFNGFDAAIVGLGFHHFEDWTGSLRKLGERVKKGGVVGIVDLVPSEEHWHNVTPDMRKMMHKSGFTDEEMKGYMAEAGLVDFEMIHLPEPVVMQMKDAEVKRVVFFARGRKP